MKVWRYSGQFLMATGILHTLYGAVACRRTLAAVIRDGLYDTIAGNDAREFALWFLMSGILLIFWGQALHRLLQAEGRPPAAGVGWSLLLTSLTGCLLEPVSGFWLLVPQALIILLAKRRPEAENPRRK